MDQQLHDLAQTVGSLLKTHGWRLATAESCTGGLVGHAITAIAGSSHYYQGGLIAYDNAVKQHILGVSEATLVTNGAVSAQCAQEMAQEARRMFGVDASIATTGIAGPAGGSADKPVGLTFIAVATPGGLHVERIIFPGDRESNQLATAQTALSLLIRSLRQPVADAPLL